MGRITETCCAPFLSKASKPERFSLPSLDDACRVAAKRRWAAAKRTVSVTWRLLPIACSVGIDNMRRRGPRKAVKNARRLRLALEALGPAFVKLGQATAAREDILSPEVAKEMRKLCDGCAPVPLAGVLRMLAEELGAEMPDIPGEPIAAASLGQVYKVSVGGKQFAMKVQRPGLPEAIAIDIVILKRLTKVFMRVYSCVGVAQADFLRVTVAWAQHLWRELDYEHEALCMNRMRIDLCESGRVPNLLIPRVNWHLSAKRVLTTEWVEGANLTTDLQHVRPRHIKVGVDAFAIMVLELGVVHADPHAGNVLITTADDKVCLLDFGMVCEVPPPHRFAWAKALYTMTTGDHAGTLDSLISIGFFPANCPRERILQVMPKIWREIVAAGSNTRKRKEAMFACYSELKTLVREFDFDLPDYYVTLGRAMLTLEGIAISANIEFDIFQTALPVVTRWLAGEAAKSAVAAAVDAKQKSGSFVARSLRNLRMRLVPYVTSTSSLANDDITKNQACVFQDISYQCVFPLLCVLIFFMYYTSRQQAMSLSMD